MATSAEILDSIHGSTRDRYRHGVRLFNDGEFFDCHEVLESIWTGALGPKRWFLQSLIHAAVAFHHCGLGNRIGARLQFDKAVKKLAGYLPLYEGLDTLRLWAELHRASVVAASESGWPEPPKIHWVDAISQDGHEL